MFTLAVTSSNPCDWGLSLNRFPLLGDWSHEVVVRESAWRLARMPASTDRDGYTIYRTYQSRAVSDCLEIIAYP